MERQTNTHQLRRRVGTGQGGSTALVRTSPVGDCTRAWSILVILESVCITGLLAALCSSVHIHYAHCCLSMYCLDLLWQGNGWETDWRIFDSEPSDGFFKNIFHKCYVTLLYKIVKILSISALSILTLSILFLINFGIINFDIINFFPYQFCSLSILFLINFGIIDFAPVPWYQHTFFQSNLISWILCLCQTGQILNMFKKLTFFDHAAI